jgi:hypothetical protein
MKIITTIIALSLITYTIQQTAVTGCTSDKCTVCGTNGCTECLKEPVKPMTDATKTECKGTVITNCWSYDGTTCTRCSNGFTRQTSGAAHVCTANAALVATECVWATTTEASGTAVTKANTTCWACTGKKPTIGTLSECSAVTTAIAGCAAYSAEGVCAWCDTSFHLNSTTSPNTCPTWGTGDMVGCMDSTCTKCAGIHGYFMISTTGKKCALGSASATVTAKTARIFAAAFVAIAMLFSF